MFPYPANFNAIERNRRIFYFSFCFLDATTITITGLGGAERNTWRTGIVIVKVWLNVESLFFVPSSFDQMLLLVAILAVPVLGAIDYYMLHKGIEALCLSLVSLKW